MSPLPSPLASGDWSAEIGRVAELYMNAEISIFDPDDAISVPYDAATDTGGYDIPALVLTSKARIQHLRSPGAGDTGGEWVTTRAIRAQVPLADVLALPAPLRKGLIVRVNNGGRNPALTQFAFTILSAVNSSHAAVCTIECVSELTPVPAVA